MLDDQTIYLPTNGKKKEVKSRTMKLKLMSLENLLILGNVAGQLPWMCQVFSARAFHEQALLY